MVGDRVLPGWRQPGAERARNWQDQLSQSLPAHTREGLRRNSWNGARQLATRTGRRARRDRCVRKRRRLELRELMWSLLTAASTTLEAEMMKQTLESENIPVLIRGTYSGVFGGAYQGPVPGGVQILVPEEELDNARELLELEAEE